MHARGGIVVLAALTVAACSRAPVLAFAKRLGVMTEPGDTSDVVVHNLRTAIIDPQGRLVKAYSGNMWSPAELVADLKATPAAER